MARAPRVALLLLAALGASCAWWLAHPDSRVRAEALEPGSEALAPEAGGAEWRAPAAAEALSAAGARGAREALAAEPSQSARPSAPVASLATTAPTASTPWLGRGRELLVLVQPPGGGSFEALVPHRAVPILVVASREPLLEPAPEHACTPTDVRALAWDCVASVASPSARQRERGALARLLRLREETLWISLVCEQRVLASARWNAPERELAFELDPTPYLARLATLRLRVVESSSGIAVQQLAGFLRPLDEARQGEDALRFPDPEAGVLALSGLSPGRYELVLNASGYRPEKRELELLAGARLELGVLTMALADRALLQVRLRAPAGAHTRWIRAEHVERSPTGELQALARWVESADDDELVARTVVPGRWLVSAEGYLRSRRLRARPQERELAADGVYELELELEPTTPVRLRAGEERTRVRVRDERGCEACEALVLDPGGERAVELLPGAYELEVTRERLTTRITLQVGLAEQELSLP